MTTVAQRNAQIQAFQARAAQRDIDSGTAPQTRETTAALAAYGGVAPAGGTGAMPEGGYTLRTAPNYQPAPAVVTSQPALDHLTKVNNDVTNWTNQMTGSASTTNSTVTQTFDGKYQIPGDARLYGTEAEAVAALNKQMNPSAPNPNQSVIDKLDATLAPKKTDEQAKIDENQAELDKVNSQWEQIDNQFLTSLKQFQSGTFTLSPEENAQVAALQNVYNRAIANQRTANANYQGAIVNAGIAAGRNRYAPEMEAGNIQTAVQKGLDKITDLEVEAAGKIAELKQSLQDKDYARIKDLYDTTSTIMTRRAKVLQDTIDNIRQGIKDQAKARADFLKNSLDTGKAIASSLYSMLGDDKEANTALIKQYADEYGIDSNILLGAINEYATSAAKDEYSMHSSSYKEWMDYRATGGKLDYNAYQTMDANRKATRVTVNAGDSKTIEKFRNDASGFIAQLGNKKISWATAFNSLKAAYPEASNELIDQVLNREAYYNVTPVE